MLRKSLVRMLVCAWETSGMDIVSLDLDVFLFEAGRRIYFQWHFTQLISARIRPHGFCKPFIDRKHHLWMLLQGRLW